MREIAVDRLATVLRLALLSVVVAGMWLILSFIAASSHAFAGEGSESQDAEASVSGIIDSVTKPVVPVLDAVDHAVPAPLPKPLALVKSSPVGTVVGGVTGQLVDTLDDIASTVTGIVGSTVDGVLTGHVTDLVDRVVDDLIPGEFPRKTPVDVAHPFANAQSATHSIAATLWPLTETPHPWVAGDLLLISAGALSTSGTGGAAAPACDLPLARSWFGPAYARGERAPNDDVPGSLTFDTDCTPD